MDWRNDSVQTWIWVHTAEMGRESQYFWIWGGGRSTETHGWGMGTERGVGNGRSSIVSWQEVSGMGRFLVFTSQGQTLKNMSRSAWPWFFPSSLKRTLYAEGFWMRCEVQRMATWLSFSRSKLMSFRKGRVMECVTQMVWLFDIYNHSENS